MKLVYIFYLLVFEVGSIVSATARTSVALIIGRAIQGIGAACIFPGNIVILSSIVLREKQSGLAVRFLSCMLAVLTFVSLDRYCHFVLWFRDRYWADNKRRVHAICHMALVCVLNSIVESEC